MGIFDWFKKKQEPTDFKNPDEYFVWKEKWLENKNSDDITNEPQNKQPDMCLRGENMLTKDALTGYAEETYCKLCEYKLNFPQPKLVDATLVCPRCGITNILSESGSALTLTRLNFYRKYTGDFYDHTIKGLIPELKERLRSEFENIVNKRRQSGEIDEKEYKKLYGRYYRQLQKLLAELETKQNADRAIIVAEEKAILARLRKDGKL